MDQLESILRQRQSANAHSNHHHHQCDDSDMQGEEAFEVDDEDEEEEEEEVFQDAVAEGRIDNNHNISNSRQHHHRNNNGPDISSATGVSGGMDEAMMVTSNSRFLQDEFDDEAEFDDDGEDVEEDGDHEFHDLVDQSFDFSMSQQHTSSYHPYNNLSTANATTTTNNTIMSTVSNNRSASCLLTGSGTSAHFSQFTSPTSQHRY